MTLEEARALDLDDKLARCRDRFQLLDGIIYLDGNSLGALPAATPARIAEVAGEQWGKDLISSWSKHGWIDAPQRIAAKLAPIVGAAADELLVGDSTSINLFKLAMAAAAMRPERPVILTEAGNFPTDLYILEAVARQSGKTLVAVERSDLEHRLCDDVALLALTHVDYRSGWRHDMATLGRAAQNVGALTLWDLSHSAGALALDLAADGADFAVGCGYKYLNGGPGAPAFLYVRKAHQARAVNPLPGWLGHRSPFDFAAEYQPADGIGRFQTGTPPILAMAALEAGLETFDGVAMNDVEVKSRSLATLFIDEVEHRTAIDLSEQRDRTRNGSHVVVPHPSGHAVMQALIARGVIGDFRPPGLLRFGFAPLYNRFEEVWLAAEALGDILASGEWKQPRFHERQTVT